MYSGRGIPMNVKALACLLVLVGLSLALISCEGESKVTTNEPDVEGPEFLATDFGSATDCAQCHPDQYEEWSSSMHAYALRDPVFKVVRDIGQGEYANVLDQACVQCHSIVGSRSGEIPWGPYNLASLSPATQEGIGCDMCHRISAITRMSRGGVYMTPGHVKFGTVRDPVSTTAHESEYNSLYATSEYCGACHDFVTDAGLELEATYREWQAGGFAMTGKTCNDCHMPTYVGRAAPSGPERTLHRHTFIGVDLALIDDFPNRDEQMQLVTEMLRNALSLGVSMPDAVAAGETFHLDVSITNDKTGHSVPSGVPFNREMWLLVEVTDESGGLVYASGQLDANGDLMDDGSEYPERDPDLFNAQATMLRADGVPTGATWEAADLVNPAIKAGETRMVPYEFVVPAQTIGTLTVNVTLRFRSFPPHLIRALGLSELLPIPIFDMATSTDMVVIK